MRTFNIIFNLFVSHASYFCSQPKIEIDPSLEINLLQAAERGALDAIQYLIDHKTDINIKNSSQWNALHKALVHNQPKAAILLIKAGIDVNAKTKCGHTPLIYAIRFQHIEVVKLLVQQGALLTLGDASGKTPLLITTLNPRSAELISFLLDNRSNIDEVDYEGNSALQLAIIFNYINSLDALMPYNPYLYKRNLQGQTPLHAALQKAFETPAITTYIILLLAHDLRDDIETLDLARLRNFLENDLQVFYRQKQHNWDNYLQLNYNFLQLSPLHKMVFLLWASLNYDVIDTSDYYYSLSNHIPTYDERVKALVLNLLNKEWREKTARMCPALVALFFRDKPTIIPQNATLRDAPQGPDDDAPKIISLDALNPNAALNIFIDVRCTGSTS